MAKASKEETGMVTMIRNAITRMSCYSGKEFTRIHVSTAQWATLMKMRKKQQEDATIEYQGVRFAGDAVFIDGVEVANQARVSEELECQQ